MGVVRVIGGVLLLAALVGIPGSLVVRLLRRAMPRTALIPAESVFLTAALGACGAGTLALVLAMLGVYSLLLLVGVVALVSVGLALAGRRMDIPLLPERPQFTRSMLLQPQSLLLVLLVLAAVLFLRPGETIIGSEDTGVYFNSGVAIARTGHLRFRDPDLAAIITDSATVRHLLLETPHWRYRFLDGGRLHGFFASGTAGDVVPQFLHQWAVWLAIFYQIFGLAGPAYAPGVCGLLGVAAVVLAARRLCGWPVALVAGLFLTLNGMQVWFVRQTFSEPLQQFLIFTALFGFVILEERRDDATMRLGAVVAGLALGAATLAHLEILFLLPVVGAYGIALWLLRGWRQAHTWFFAVFGAMFVLALVQIAFFSLGYAEGIFHHPLINLWERRKLVAAAVVAGIVVLGVIRLMRRWWLPLLLRPAVHRSGRYAVAAATALYLVWGYIVRPHIVLGGAGDWTAYIGAPTPPGNAANLVRLGWYWSPLGIALASIGAVLLIGQRLDRRSGGVLAFALVHAVIFVDATYTREYYLYALRRDLPIIVPVCAIFAAYAVCESGAALAPIVARFGAGFMRAARRIVNGGGVLAALALVVFLVATGGGAWTIRRYAGAEAQIGSIAASFPPNSLLLFVGDRDQPHLLATPLTYIYDRAAFVVSTDYPRGDLLETWLLRESATRPVYILMGDTGGKLFLPHTALVPDIAHGPSFTLTLRDFEALQKQKPHNLQENTLRFTVYRFDARAGTDGPLGTAPLTITAGQSDEKYNVQGFYGIEHTKTDPTIFRWTSTQAIVRVPWSPSLSDNGGTLTLRLAGGERPAKIGAAHLRVALDTGLGEPGNPIAEFDLAPDWQTVTIPIPPHALPPSDDGTALVRLDSCITRQTKDRLVCSAWSPQDSSTPDEPNYDIRVLGVKVQSVTIAPR